MLLHEIGGGSANKAVVVQEMRKYAELLNHIHFFTYFGGGGSFAKDADVNAQGSFRAIGSDYGSKVTAAPSPASFTLKIFGKEVQTDRAYERQGIVPGGADIGTQVVRSLKGFARTLGRNLQYYLINGDSSVTATEFNGIKKVVSGMDATQTLTLTGDNGLQILAGTDNTAKTSQQKFVEFLRELIANVEGGPSFLLMNERLISRMATIARDNVSTTVNEFGMPIKYFDEIPLVPGGYKYDGSFNMPLSETKGTSTDCTTVYAVRSEEMAYWSLMTTPNGVWVSDPRETDNFIRTTVELQADSGAPFNKRAIACLPGVRIG